jgi:hypothetical protein
MLGILIVLWGFVLCTTIGISAFALRSSRFQLIAVWAIVLIAFILRGGFFDSQFYGLEYEDAFIYAAASRQVHSFTPNLGGSEVCAVGSVSECLLSETFPGHLLGYTALLSGAQFVIGFHPSLPPLISAITSSITSLALWFAAWGIYRSRLAANGAALLYAVTPALALYGGSALSESVSSLPVALSIGAAAATRRTSNKREWLWWHTVVLASVALAATVRRENAVWIIALPLLILLSSDVSVGARMKRLAALPWAILGVNAAIPILRSLLSEAGEYSGFSFGVVRLIETVPVVIRALITPTWFGLLAIVALVGSVAILRRSNRREQTDTGLLMAIAIATVVSIALYASHVRSTYQLMGAPVEPFDFLRYLSNIGVPLCLLASALILRINQWTMVKPLAWKCTGLAILAVYALWSATGSVTLRTQMVSIEREVRWDAAEAAVEAASELGDIYPIVTLEPLVIQSYANPGTKTIDLALLTPEIIRSFGGRVLYLRQDHYENDANRVRYAEGFSALPNTNMAELRKGSTWSVISLGIEQTAKPPVR